MIELSNHTLDSKEITDLNNNGHDLDESKESLYIIRFLWNNKLNKAYVPHPFRVVPELNEHLVKDAIDMPYVVGPDPNEHLEGEDEGLPNTAESLLKIQADYTIGPIKKVLRTVTDNFYGIIKVFPGYHDDVLNGKLPPLGSPTFEPIEFKGQDLIKANFLNLNAVNSGGYPVALTKIVGVCKNGIKQCMSELSVYAAAGSLREERTKESFSSTILKNIKSMSNEEGATPDVATIAKDLDATKQEVLALGQRFSGMETTVKAIATKIGVETKDGGKESPDGPPAEAKGPETLQLGKVDISKHPAFVELSDKFNDVKKLSDKREKQIAADEAKHRLKIAESIVDLTNKGKKLSDAERETQIKQWVEKKDADDNLENIELVESTLKATLPKEEPKDEIASASGPLGTFPGIKGDIDSENTPKNISIIANTNGRQS